jgi:hypothetical protein
MRHDAAVLLSSIPLAIPGSGEQTGSTWYHISVRRYGAYSNMKTQDCKLVQEKRKEKGPLSERKDLEDLRSSASARSSVFPIPFLLLQKQPVCNSALSDEP